MARMAVVYPRKVDEAASLRVQALPADGTIPGMQGWRWIHTPGHTAGHISLFRADDRTLIVGDAFCTTKQKSFLVAVQLRELASRFDELARPAHGRYVDHPVRG